jgi:hypothetical protein
VTGRELRDNHDAGLRFVNAHAGCPDGAAKSGHRLRVHLSRTIALLFLRMSGRRRLLCAWRFLVQFVVALGGVIADHILKFERFGEDVERRLG